MLVIFEVMLRICRSITWAILPDSFGRYVAKDSDMGDAISLIVTLFIIVIIITLGIYISEFIAIEHCVDSGAKWGIELQKCIFQ